MLPQIFGVTAAVDFRLSLLAGPAGCGSRKAGVYLTRVD